MNVRPGAPDPLHPDAHTMEAVDSSGSVRGRISFDTWRPNSAAVHIELDSPLALRKLLPAALFHAFEKMNLGVVFGFIRANSRAHLLARRLGFKSVGVVRDGYAVGVNLYIYELRRDACAFGLTRKAA